MCKENCTEINLSSSVFNEMRDNFDAILKKALGNIVKGKSGHCLLYTSPSPRDTR